MDDRIRLRRIHDEDPADDTGTRVLVDRVWPRGIRKADARLDHWYKELAPSTELRKWFGHDPERWDAFRERYRAELQAPEPQARLDELAAIARQGPLTLLFGAKDTEHNQAVVLRELLRERLGQEG